MPNLYAEITGFDVDDDGNGIKYIDEKKTLGSNQAKISNESIYLYDDGQLKGNLVVDNSSIFAFQPNHPGKFLSYSNTDGNDGSSLNVMKFINGSNLIVSMTNERKNIAIKELRDNSSISCVGKSSGGLFVYTGKDAILKNCRLENIKNIECITPFKEFQDVELINTQIGMLNWQAGRVDRYRINIPSTQSGWDSWLGTDNNGKNYFWDWNPIHVNPLKIVHQHTNSRYYLGYTATYQFVDKESLTPVKDVKVYFSDSFDNPSKFKLVAELYTDQNGKLRSSYDTRLRSNNPGTDKSKPTIFFLTQNSKLTSGTVSTGLSDPTTSYKYKLDTVQIKLDVRSYAHEFIPDNYSIESELGRINSKQEALEFQDYYLTPDKYITEQDVNKVKKYRRISNTAELYDYLKYMWVNDQNLPYVNVEASKLSIPDGWTLLLNDQMKGSKAVNINSTKKEIQIKCKNLKPTKHINVVQAVKGYIKFASHAEYISMPYIDSENNSYVLFTNIDSHDSVVVKDESKLKFIRNGEFGFTYKSQNKDYQVYIYKQDGTIARKNFPLSHSGIYNTFSVSYDETDDDFTQIDRKELVTIPEGFVLKLENDKSLLTTLKAWVIWLTKKKDDIRR